MKKIILISGVFGTLFLVLRLIGTATNFEHNKQLLIAGVVLLALVYLPLSLFDNYLQRKKIKGIIKKHKDDPNKTSKFGESKAETKGWGMNNSPFRTRKSGLTWGGGNIKGANASRGVKRTFMK